MSYKNKEQILLEQAYAKVSEGIWDRFKGTAAGIGAGLKQGAQNIASNVAGKLGATVTPSGKSGKEAYAQAQQKSIFNSFIKKAEAEIQEFEEDAKKLGKDELGVLSSSHPEIAEMVRKYKVLLATLKNMQQTTQAVS